MTGDIDKRFLKVAVEEGLITREQLNECTELQKVTGKPLAFIMLQKGYVTDEMLSLMVLEGEKPSHIKEIQTKQAEEDRIFRILAIAKGFATKEQLEECIQTQLRFKHARFSIPLKTLMVKKGYMKHDQVLEVLEMKGNVLYCPFCEKQYVPQKTVKPGRIRRCKECGSALTPAFPEEYRKGADEDTRRRKQEISRRVSREEK